MEKEEKAFVEYWFGKKNKPFYRQNDGSRMVNIVKKFNFKVIDDEKLVCLGQTILNKPSKGERYAPKGSSEEYEIIEKLDDRYIYSIKVDDEILQIECDVYKVKRTK